MLVQLKEPCTKCHRNIWRPDVNEAAGVAVFTCTGCATTRTLVTTPPEPDPNRAVVDLDGLDDSIAGTRGRKNSRRSRRVA